MKFSSFPHSFAILAAAAILGFAVSAVAQSESGKPPAWIADSKTGCKVWNPAP
jgi:hypothetical protein